MRHLCCPVVKSQDGSGFALLFALECFATLKLGSMLRQCMQLLQPTSRLASACAGNCHWFHCFCCA